MKPKARQRRSDARRPPRCRRWLRGAVDSSQPPLAAERCGHHEAVGASTSRKGRRNGPPGCGCCCSTSTRHSRGPLRIRFTRNARNDIVVALIRLGNTTLRCARCEATDSSFCVFHFQFSVFLGLIFFLELTAGILAFVFKDWIKDQLNLFINKNVKAYRDDIDLQNVIDFAQEYVSQPDAGKQRSSSRLGPHLQRCCFWAERKTSSAAEIVE